MGYIQKREVRQKEIVLLKVPFSNLRESKLRPAIVVSNNDVNRQSGDCILVPLTSVLKDAPYAVAITQNDLAYGEILKESRARADKIFTAEKDIIVEKVGQVTEVKFQQIKQQITATL